MTIIGKNTTFWGYKRENGRVGVRNHVIILPLDDLSNSASEAVAHNVKGTMAILASRTVASSSARTWICTSRR